MRYGFRRASLADLYAIGADPAPVTRHEFMRQGQAWWHVMKGLRPLLDPMRANTRAFTFVEGAEPTAVMGYAPHVERTGILVTWFVCRRRYFEAGAVPVLALRRLLRSIAFFHPGVCFDVYSWSPSREAVRWFGLLGFDPMPASLYAELPRECRVFRLTAPTQGA